MKGRKVYHKENISDTINEIIQLDYLSNKERLLNDLSMINSNKLAPLKDENNS